MEEVLRHVSSLVTQERRDLLLRPFQIGELEKYVKQMKDDKSLGPDGFTTNFFHFCWDLVKNEVMETVEDSR